MGIMYHTRSNSTADTFSSHYSAYKLLRNINLGVLLKMKSGKCDQICVFEYELAYRSLARDGVCGLVNALFPRCVDSFA
jgi:hypothetical protein